ncbi:MAG: hypothetical protein V9E81_13430 [Marmoricola sp.]
MLAGLEPEDEAGMIFLRLRKRPRRGGRVVTIAPFTTRGTRKMHGHLVAHRARRRGRSRLAKLKHGVDKESVILVGERLATVPGALTAAAAAAAKSGARLAWVPRRAGDRGALETGCLPTLLPGGRPVADAGARVDVAATWGVDHLPETAGRDADDIVAAAASGELGALVIGGVDPDDTGRPGRDAQRPSTSVVRGQPRPARVIDHSVRRCGLPGRSR